MDPLTMGLIFGGGGLLKGMTIDKAKADSQRKLAAETARYSPWTGMVPGAVDEADPFGSALQFGTTGAMMGQGMQNQAADQAFKNRWLGVLEGQGGTGGGRMVPPMFT